MSINYELIRELKAWAKQYIEDKIAAGIVKYGLYSRSTASGEGDAIRGYQIDGADEQQYDFAGRRVFPFGIRSRPPSGTWGVWIGKGGRSGDGIIVGAESSRFGPSNLNDGEVAIYNKVTGCMALFDQNGGISFTAAAGQTVNSNGTTYSMPQWDPFTTAFNTFVGTLAGITTPVATLVQCAAALNTIIAAAITLQTAMSANSSYKSTKAKNG